MKFLTLLSFLTFSAVAQAELVDKVIYGNDDRFDVFESNDSLMRELSRSTAAMIYNNNLIEKPEWTYTLKAPTLQERIGACKTERFSEQPVAGNCSGFLIAPDKLVTAGHCVSSVAQCASHYWVFDFANYESNELSFIFNETQVARCRGVIERVKDSETGVDYAVLQLDRKMQGRRPFEVRRTSKVDDDAILTVIGNPSGLPTKIASGIEIRDNSKKGYFTGNSDTYHGNSGSAVVDSRTGIVEGILVRGDTDYTRTEEGCTVSVVRDNASGRGEDITRITEITKI